MNNNKGALSAAYGIAAAMAASSVLAGPVARSDTTPPTVPQDLAAQVLNDTTIKLTWTPSTDNAGVAGYQVLVYGDIVAQVTSASYRHEKLMPATNYRYRLRAYDGSGNLSGLTEPLVVNTGDSHRPDVPQGLTATVVNDQTIQLDWMPAADNVATVGYKVFNRGQQIADVATTSFLHQNLLPVTTYRYTVRAYDAAGNLSFEEPQVVVNSGDTTAPSMPADPEARVINDTTVKLTWTPSTDNAGVAGYQVLLFGSVIAQVSEASFRHEKLMPATNYRYKLRAYDGHGNLSGLTEPIIAYTGDTNRPDIPQGLSAEVLNDQTIRLQWLPADDNVATVGYKVYNRGAEIADVSHTGFIHQNLTPVTTYRYSVRAYDAVGNLSFENPQLVVNTGDTTAPTAPQALVAQVVNDGKVALTWQASSDNAAVAGYRVFERSTLLAEVSATTFNHTGLAPVSQYLYAVVAFDATGNQSLASQSAVAYTGDTTPPARPPGLQAQVLNDRHVRLNWLAPADNVGVAGYRVFNRGEQIADVTTTSFDHVRLLPATVYKYSVKAYDLAGNLSAQEQPVFVNTGDSTAPLPPPGMSTVPRGENEVKVLWQAAQDNVSVAGYRLYESGNLLTEGTARNFIHSGLAVATAYHYTVVSYDAAGNESDSTPTLTYTTPDNTLPGAPTGVQAEVLDDSRVLLTWSPATDNVGVSHYRILDSGVQVGGIKATKFLHEGLLPETTHLYKVRAVDAAGNVSSAQPAVSVNTGDTNAPTVPGGLSAVALDDATVSLSWLPSSDNVEVRGYRLFESGALLDDLDTTAFVHSGLQPVTDYNYTLVAYDAAGNESAPTPIVSTNTGDTTPPTMPGAFKLSIVNSTTIALSWIASTDNVAVTGYEVLADGQRIDTLANNGILLTGLPPDESRSYSVRAIDAAGLVSPATAPLAASPTDDTSIDRLHSPFIPLTAQLNIADRPAHEQDITPAELEQIAASYEAIWTQSIWLLPTDQIESLRDHNPSFEVLAYINSSHSRSAETDLGIAEAQRLSMINVYLEGYLDEALSSTDITFAIRPADPERGWGLTGSTITGELTASSEQYVTYLRIDDELMRIEAVDAAAGLVTVSRGFQGTVAAPHVADAPVLAPVYTGPGGDDGLDQSIPGNSSGRLPSYSLQVGTPEAAEYFASQVQSLLDFGANGAWLDICSPEFFNQSNALGAPVVPWNLETGAEFTAPDRRLHHDRKLARMQQGVMSASSQWPMLVANNNSNGKYFEEGGRAMDFLLPTEAKPVPIDGVVLEAAFSRATTFDFFNEARWKRNLSTIVHGSQNGLPVWPWIKSATNDYRPDTAEAERFELYDYASILLGWEPGSPGLVSLPLFAQDGGGRSLNLPDWLFLDLGEPLEQVAYDAVEGLRVPGLNSYMRRWSNGLVLVNPSSEADPSVPLPGQYLIPHTGQKVSSIGVPANTGMLLILDD